MALVYRERKYTLPGHGTTLPCFLPIVTLWFLQYLTKQARLGHLFTSPSIMKAETPAVDKYSIGNEETITQRGRFIQPPYHSRRSLRL